MDVPLPPSTMASEHTTPTVESAEEAREATASSSAAKGKEKEQRVDAALEEHEASTSKDHLTSSQDAPSRKPSDDAHGVPRDEPAATSGVSVPQELLNKLIDTLSELKGPEKLSGWAGIEDHLAKHDTGEMKYYGEDIDTLLVFAGLFSAFLTAFVVQTYPMLADDDSSTTNQLLALSVAMQIRATGTIIPTTVNSTLTSLIDTQPFSPGASARAINILFFLSLVLSLSAALFGILAKQWLREYLRWNSPLALPRENVLVRQDRIEAWEAWNVAAMISSIPALLEIAMILFLCGVVVLLWTLDNLVAIIITIVAALFLLAAAMFTLLPIIYTRCPYKSPTAWACVAAYEVVLRLFKKACFSRASSSKLGSWRQRDLESCRKVRGKGKKETYTVSNTGYTIFKAVVEFPDVKISTLNDFDWVLDSIAETALLIQCATSFSKPFPNHISDPNSIAAAYNVLWRTISLAMQQNLLEQPHTSLAYPNSLSDHSVPDHRRHFFQMIRPMMKWDEGCTKSRKELAGQLMLADLKRVIGQSAEHVNLSPAMDMCITLCYLGVGPYDNPSWLPEALRVQAMMAPINWSTHISSYGPIYPRMAGGERLKVTSDNVLGLSSVLICSITESLI
ncbi:hypothetical protein PsYK624_137140 [Phanerochaete sordida]|uniref:DUF6535 domain-containing protein n=1 Tax=Phanerochaete sordida TaxID=48140 RepID=A0A9P3GM61_9APHY|nr:hypothetical protein PsYK624_137140 [Phanerochaete sordida]